MDENKNIEELRPIEKEQHLLDASTGKRNRTPYFKEFIILF